MPASASDTRAADATEEVTSTASMKAALFAIVMFILPRPDFERAKICVPFMLDDIKTIFCAPGHTDSLNVHDDLGVQAASLIVRLHSRMANQVMRLAEQFGPGIAADRDEIRVAAGNPTFRSVIEISVWSAG